MTDIDIEGREAAVNALKKRERITPNNIGAREVSWFDIEEAVAPYRSSLRKGDSTQRRRARTMRSCVLKAVHPQNLKMQWNGIPAGVDLIKMAQEHVTPYDPDMLTRASFGTLAFPPQSSNAFDDGTRNTLTGARLASLVVNDEATDLNTKPKGIGSQAVTDVSDSSNIAATLDALRADVARGAKPYLA